MENAKCYAPQILVGTEGLPREQWLEYRRKGIGGSDAAAVLGISPFRTGRDLYYDKLNIVTADDAENWVQLEVGTLLEPLVAKIFTHKTGYKIYRRPFMFQHPLYPWMLADLDYMVELPDGTTAILEIKTTNYNAKDNWWYNGEEIVPIYYESQGRHYMAVMNINRVYFCCLYGNSEDEAIIRRIDRDMAYEEELIALERDFWENHVLTKTPPPYVEEDGDLILESLRRKLGPADKDAPPVLLGQTQFGQLSMLLSLQEQKKTLSADVNKLEKDIKRLKGMLIERIVLKGLGENLRKIAMHITNDFVTSAVNVNFHSGISTWCYFDEFHILLRDALTASYFVAVWKMLRKKGCVPSALTQNVKDLLASREIEAILDNTDFMILLAQAQSDRAILAKQLGISEHQLSYITHSNSGEGLLFYGDVTIPFVDRFPKGEIYNLLTTRPEDLKNEAKTE